MYLKNKLLPNIKNNYLIIAVIVLAFIIRIGTLYVINTPVIDELWDMQMISAHLSSPNPFADLYNSSKGIDMIQARLPIFFSWPVYFIFRNIVSLKIVSILINILIIFFTYLIGCRLFSKKAGLISALYLALLPFFAGCSNLSLSTGQNFDTLFIVLAFYYFLIFHGSAKHFGLLGIFSGLAVASKFSSIFIILPFFLFFFIKQKKYEVPPPNNMIFVHIIMLMINLSLFYLVSIRTSTVLPLGIYLLSLLAYPALLLKGQHYYFKNRSLNILAAFLAMVNIALLATPTHYAIFSNNIFSWLSDIGFNRGLFNYTPLHIIKSFITALNPIFFILFLFSLYYLLFKKMASSSGKIITIMIISIFTCLTFLTLLGVFMPFYLMPALPFCALCIGYTLERYIREIKYFKLVTLMAFLVLLGQLMLTYPYYLWSGTGMVLYENESTKAMAIDIADTLSGPGIIGVLGYSEPGPGKSVYTTVAEGQMIADSYAAHLNYFNSNKHITYRAIGKPELLPSYRHIILLPNLYVFNDARFEKGKEIYIKNIPQIAVYRRSSN